MNELKEKALEKMLDEMNKKHSGAEDSIHNWLCDQTDDKLFEGILKNGRTIKGALQYCASQASKQKSNNVAMIDDDTVFRWVYKYFTDEKAPKNLNMVKATVTTDAADKTTKPKSKRKKAKQQQLPEGEQLDLLSFI